MSADRLSTDILHEHDWSVGEFVRKERWERYKTRTDICTKCGCTRIFLLFKHRGRSRRVLHGYERSGIFFDKSHNFPLCWGAKTIK